MGGGGGGLLNNTTLFIMLLVPVIVGCILLNKITICLIRNLKERYSKLSWKKWPCEQGLLAGVVKKPNKVSPQASPQIVWVFNLLTA